MAFLKLILTILFVLLNQSCQTKLKSDKEEAYQKLASKAVEAQKTALLNKKLAEEMTDIRQRLTSIERILKEVEKISAVYK